MSRIDDAFARSRREKRGAFIPYLTAGYPRPDVFDAVIDAAAKSADIIEIGIPFSDPVADGPIIQASSEEALRAGVGIEEIFQSVRRFRTRSETPIVLMGYANPVFHYGEARFVAAAHAAGVDGVIVPDWPPEDASGLIDAARPLDFATIFLAAPTSSDARIERIAKASTGYVYVVSRLGVTGVTQTPTAELGALISRVRASTSLPIAAGFGISQPEHVRAVCGHADAAIVGSALVRLMSENADAPDLPAIVARECARLASGTNRMAG